MSKLFVIRNYWLPTAGVVISGILAFVGFYTESIPTYFVFVIVLSQSILGFVGVYNQNQEKEKQEKRENENFKDLKKTREAFEEHSRKNDEYRKEKKLLKRRPISNPRPA